MRILTNQTFATFSAQNFSAGKIKEDEYGFSKVGEKIYPYKERYVTMLKT